MKKIFTFFGLVTTAALMNAQIVINEVYGGGGNTGALYTNDFVELINRGNTTVTLTGASLQYASATGTFNSYQALPDITLAPGQKYLIQEFSNGATGAALPTPDFVPTSSTGFTGQTYQPFNISGTSGKIALANNLSQVVSPTDANVVDFVGYGTGNAFEGTAAAPAPSNTTSISRNNGADTNNNSNDFTVGAPTPQNSTSGTLAVSDLSKAHGHFVRNSFVKNNEITFGAEVKDVKVYTMSGQLVKTASVKENESVSVAELAKGNYILTGTVNNKPVSQKILKD